MPESTPAASKRKKRSRLKDWAFKLILMSLSTGLALVAIEIGLRLFASSIFEAQSDSPLVPSSVSGLGYQVAPNLSTPVARTDENGIRRRDGPEDVDQRVLLLGDSIAFASFIRYELSFAPLLEKFLNERLGETVGIWNAGTPGYNTTQEAIQLEALSPKVKPEFVILQYCMNDYLHGVRLTAGGQLDATGGNTDSGFSFAGLPNSSFAYIFFKEKVKDAQRLWPEWFPAWAHYVHYIDQKDGFKLSLESLLKIQATAKRIGAELLVVIFPVEQQLRIDDRVVQDRLVQFASANDIKVLDLHPVLAKRWREGLYVDFWNQAKMVDKLHLNELGHRVVADTIGEYVLERKSEFFRRRSSAAAR